MILLYILLSMLGCVSTRKNTYIVTVPQQVRPGSTADISLTSPRNRLNNVQITAWLLDKSDKQYSTVTESFRNKLAGKPLIAKLKVPKDIIDEPRGNAYKIRVKATGDIRFDKTVTRIGINKKASSIFIQTDRPLYKPGDLVQFRIVGTNSTLNILDDALNITIEDPKRNRLKQFINVKPELGVFAGSFQLSSLTTLGDWMISVAQMNEKKTKSFSVERYVLPKFEVNIATPSFQLKTDRFFEATITAMYTFGKPVSGEVFMKIKRRWSSDSEAIEKTFMIDGNATLRILMSELKPTYRTDVEVFARVKESVTGKEINTTKSVTIYETPEKMEFSSSMAETFKPGLDYNIALRIMQQDDTPLKQRLGSINITVTYDVLVPVNRTSTQSSGDQVMATSRNRPQPKEYKTRTLWSRNVNITESGVIEMVAKFPASAESGNVRADYRMSSTSKGLSRAESPSRNYIQVAFPGDKEAKDGENLPLQIKTTEGVAACDYKVFSKGSIVDQGQFKMNKRKDMRHEIMITNNMAPQALLLLYYTRSDGEIVADAARISVADMFQNKVSLSFNKARVKPNEEVSLKVAASPQSMVNILAVDKSILLMKTGNDITKDDVFNELRSYSNNYITPIRPWEFRFPRPVPGRDAFSIFNNAGVYVLTDSYLYQYNPEPRMQRSSLMSGAPGFSADSANAEMMKTGGGSNDLASPSRTRKNFPETWLWVSGTTGIDGTVTMTANAPDTITQWITSAFAVNTETGLGVVADTANVTTYQDFFMRLELPYSVIRGEIIILQISVFNYLSTQSEVVVKLNQNAGFDFADANGNPLNVGTDGINKTVTVKSKSVDSVFFPIIPKELGKIKLTSSARSKQAADAVERELLVEAEGLKETYNVPLLIDLRNQQSFSERINITFPQNVVKDSEFIKLQVIGDIMGPTLSNLDEILREYSGNGESNIGTFAPNVYVGSYLKATNRLNGDLKTKVSKLLESGYQRQLSFVHYDGSFSAFGNSDASGSTWVTALVVKTFAPGAEFTFIDNKVVTSAIRWLLRQQTPDGDFSEPGLTHHKAMQGGSPSSKRSLTAFVLIALQEAKSSDQIETQMKQTVDAAITKATNYIAKDAPVAIGNVYELAIVTYALTLVNHPLKDQLLTVLEKRATSKDGEKYWTLSKTDADIIQPWKDWSPPNNEFKAIDVEITSYVLLVYNNKNDIIDNIRVLKWLSKQRLEQGGYSSSMSTILGIQALAGLGEKLSAPNLNADITVKGGTWPGQTFKVDKSNSLVLQSVDAPNELRSVTVEATGTGISLVEAAVSFNVLEELREPAFSLNYTILDDSINGFKLRPCFSWKKEEQSSMGILEISVPTGMDADLDTLDTSQTGGLFKKSEKAFRQINLYFDAISAKQMCVEVRIDRVNLVARHKAVPIRLSEISEPSNEAVVFYESKALAKASIVQVCGQGKCTEVKK